MQRNFAFITRFNITVWSPTARMSRTQKHGLKHQTGQPTSEGVLDDLMSSVGSNSRTIYHMAARPHEDGKTETCRQKKKKKNLNPLYKWTDYTSKVRERHIKLPDWTDSYVRQNY